MSLLTEHAELFESQEVDKVVESTILTLLKSPLTTKELLSGLQEAGHPVFCLAQLEPYLTNSCIKSKNCIIVNNFAVTVYYTEPTSEEEVDLHIEALKAEYIDLYKLYRVNTNVNNSHKQIITILNHSYATLPIIQRLLNGVQSKDGVRGRVAELVDKDIVRRYYFTIRDKNTGESHQYVYHYLPMHREKMLNEIQDTLSKNPNLEKVYAGAEYEDIILSTIATRPVFVVELAEIAGVSENTMLSYLREFESDDLLGLFYQSILSDGKNGKFVIYDPYNRNSLKHIVDQLTYFFTNDNMGSVEKFRNLRGHSSFKFEEFVSDTGMCETLAVAYLTHLRKLEKIEQLTESTVTVSEFKYI